MLKVINSTRGFPVVAAAKLGWLVSCVSPHKSCAALRAYISSFLLYNFDDVQLALFCDRQKPSKQNDAMEVSNSSRKRKEGGKKSKKKEEKSKKKEKRRKTRKATSSIYIDTSDEESSQSA